MVRNTKKYETQQANRHLGPGDNQEALTMAISVTPQEYSKVDFDAEEITATATAALARFASLDPSTDVAIEVDEDAATNRVKIVSLDPVQFSVESGALENYRIPRTLGPAECELAFTRLFLELGDRRSDEFGAPQLDEVLSHAERMAWDVSLFGRASRMGLRVHQPRHRYNFRNRHGFSDLADRTFERLWSSDDLGWLSIKELSAQALDPVITENPA